MSSLTIITGTIEEAEDPFFRLNPADLYYEKWEEDYNDEHNLIISREPVPVRYYSDSKFRIGQYLGSGKTLLAMHILSQKVFYGGKVTANLGLVWDNIDIPKKEDWVVGLQSMEDLSGLSSITGLIDDIKSTILKWNVKEADIVSEIANAGRKTNLDLIVTAQREKMVPPELRDIASEWIVPIIRVRDFTRETPDNTGYPLEMIALHFDGSKMLKYVSSPIVDLDRLFACYSTMQKAVGLKDRAVDGARPNQPGYALEVEAFEFLCKELPSENWQHLNGKHVFDIVGDHNAIDVVGQDPDGKLYLEHKDLTKHIRTAKGQSLAPWLMYRYKSSWWFSRINYSVSDRIQGKRVDPAPTQRRTVKELVR